MAAKSWNQLSNEPDEAYAHFLIYRNVGPGRSLRRAYIQFLKSFKNYSGASKRVNPPTTWREQCVKWDWVERATAWDIRILATSGAQIAALHAIGIKNVAKKNLRASRHATMGTDEWADLMAAFRTVSAFLTPEIVKCVSDFYRDEPEPEPAAADPVCADAESAEQDQVR